MTSSSPTHTLIIILAFAQVATGGYLYHLLRPSTPSEAVVESRPTQPQRLSTLRATPGEPRPTAVPITETDEDTGTQDGAILSEVEGIVRPLVPATDVAGLARAFDEEQALEHIAYLASEWHGSIQPILDVLTLLGL